MTLATPTGGHAARRERPFPSGCTIRAWARPAFRIDRLGSDAIRSAIASEPDPPRHGPDTIHGDIDKQLMKGNKELEIMMKILPFATAVLSLVVALIGLVKARPDLGMPSISRVDSEFEELKKGTNRRRCSD